MVTSYRGKTLRFRQLYADKISNNPIKLNKVKNYEIIAIESGLRLESNAYPPGYELNGGIFWNHFIGLPSYKNVKSYAKTYAVFSFIFLIKLSYAK